MDFAGSNSGIKGGELIKTELQDYQDNEEEVGTLEVNGATSLMEKQHNGWKIIMTMPRIYIDDSLIWFLPQINSNSTGNTLNLARRQTYSLVVNGAFSSVWFVDPTFYFSPNTPTPLKVYSLTIPDVNGQAALTIRLGQLGFVVQGAPLPQFFF